MNKFNKFGGKPSFKKPFNKFNKFDDRGGRDDRPSSGMHHANCAKCGADCQVPFRPNGKKPVFCEKCFTSAKDMSAEGFGSDRPRRDTRPSFDRPSFDRPAPSSRPDPRIDDLQQQLSKMNSKLDALFDIVKGQNAPKATPAAAPVPAAEKPKAAKKAPAKKAAAKKAPPKKAASKKK